MKTSAAAPVIESLESKVAPAGLVTAVLAGGVLTLTGDFNANQITITETLPDQFTIAGAGATQIKFGTADPAGTVSLRDAVIHTIKADFKEGNDVITLVNVDLAKDLVVNQGIGDNTTNLNNLLIHGSVTVQGGGGADTVNLNTRFQAGGSASFKLGDGLNTVQETVSVLYVQGALNYTGGNSVDILLLIAADFFSVGSVNVQGGAGAGVFVLQSDGDLAVRGAVSMTTLDHAGTSVSTKVQSIGNCDIGGNVTMKNGTGMNAAAIGSDDGALAVVGSVSITSGNATGSSITEIFGNFVSITGSVAIKNGNGVFNTLLISPTMEIGGALSITNGNAGGTITNTLVSASTALDIGGGLTVVNGNGTFINTLTSARADIGGKVSITNQDSMAGATTNTITATILNTTGISLVNGDGLFTNTVSVGSRIAGSVIITQGDSISQLTSTLSFASVAGSITIKNGNGDFRTSFGGVNMAVGGSISIKNGTAGAQGNIINFDLTGSIDIDGSVNFQNAGGTSFNRLNAQAVLDIRGNLTVTNGSTGNLATVFTHITGADALRIGGSVAVTNGSGIYETIIHSAHSTSIGGSVLMQEASHSLGMSNSLVTATDHLRVNGGITIKSLGGEASVIVAAEHVFIGGAVSLTFGDQANFLTISGTQSFISGAVNASFGNGNSRIVLGSDNGTTIKGGVTLSALVGDDEWTLKGPGRVSGNVSLNPGLGITSTIVLTAAGYSLDIGGSLTGQFAGVTGTSSLSLLRCTVLGGLTLTGGSAADSLVTSTSTLRGPVTMTSGEGADTFNTAVCTFLGAVSLQTGGGGDTVVINDSQFHGTFSAQTGSGADSVFLENAEGLGLPTQFRKPVSLFTGDDVDTIILAGNSATRVLIVAGGLTVDGGAGADSLTQGTQISGTVTPVNI